MSEPMKILIAYDGSNCAEAALDGLERAGLPQKAQVTVMSVAEMWPPAPDRWEMVDARFHQEASGPIGQAEFMALRAAERLRAAFPGWAVTTDAGYGSPARALLEKADEWQPGLIVVGSHGRSALGRVILGSVSQKVMTEAHCSVRIARARRGASAGHGKPVRLLIAIDGSAGAECAVEAMMARTWPAGSEALVVTADFELPSPPTQVMLQLAQWIGEQRGKMRAAALQAVARLNTAGLTATSLMKAGEPKAVLCAEAESWGADCIFIGAKNHSRVDRFLLGSVSAAVAARAHCSVEIVRARQA